MQLSTVVIVYELIALVFAISVHEAAHAWTANLCGDPTARMLGRVTLNPIKHADPIGTILLPAVCIFSGFPVFGWGKPTPVDPRNFKHEVRDDILTSVAGPISNFGVALIAIFVLRIIMLFSPAASLIVLSSISGAVVDNGSILVPIVQLLSMFVLINVILGVFNLIPVPPLDGSHVLRHFLSEGVRRIYDTVGVFALILLVFVGGRFLSALLNPVLAAFYSLLVRS